MILYDFPDITKSIDEAVDAIEDSGLI